MTAVAGLSVHSEFDFEMYLSQMERPEPVRIPSPNPERYNPLNESFEDKCQLNEAARKFLESVGVTALPKLQRLVFNQLTQQRIVLFRKVNVDSARVPISLALLHRIANAPGRVLFVYKTEAKANAYLTQLRESSPALKPQSYLSPLNSMILNDKRAVTKPYRFLAFPLPRLVNLLNHKSLELSGISFVFFVETDAILKTHAADFEAFVNLVRQKGRETQLGFVAADNLEETTATLGDYFGGLASFENRLP